MNPEPGTATQTGEMPEPPAREVLSVDKAMQMMLTIARRIELSAGTVEARADLADLTVALGRALNARASVDRSQVFADQQAQRSEDKRTERARLLAAESLDVVRTYRKEFSAAFTALAQLVVTIGGRAAQRASDADWPLSERLTPAGRRQYRSLRSAVERADRSYSIAMGARKDRGANIESGRETAARVRLGKARDALRDFEARLS